MTFFLAIHDTFKDDVSLHQVWAWCFWGLVTVWSIQRYERIIIVTYTIISICFEDGIIMRTRTDGLMIGDMLEQVTTYTISAERLRETTCPFFGRIINFRASNYRPIILILIGWDLAFFFFSKLWVSFYFLTYLKRRANHVLMDSQVIRIRTIDYFMFLLLS